MIRVKLPPHLLLSSANFALASWSKRLLWASSSLRYCCSSSVRRKVERKRGKLVNIKQTNKNKRNEMKMTKTEFFKHFLSGLCLHVVDDNYKWHISTINNNSDSSWTRSTMFANELMGTPLKETEVRFSNAFTRNGKKHKVACNRFLFEKSDLVSSHCLISRCSFSWQERERNTQKRVPRE